MIDNETGDGIGTLYRDKAWLQSYILYSIFGINGVVTTHSTSAHIFYNSCPKNHKKMFPNNWRVEKSLELIINFRNGDDLNFSTYPLNFYNAVLVFLTSAVI